MKRDLTKPKVKEKIIKLPISRFIDTKYRDYAIYVVESRGIPSFYDALTPVQRYILKNAPTTFHKSLTLIGKVIQDGYHHGDKSANGALNKLARPFGNAIHILEGDGFFGTEVSPDPAAARYTSVKISSIANSILNKYDYLTTRIIEGPYNPFWMDIPLGLTSPIVGIAVGYKTTILPRKLKDIEDFLEGKRKSLKPYFEGFGGNIEKFKNLDKSWLMTSIISEEGKKIMVRELPPILKYDTVLKKLDQLLNKYEHNIRIVNNSNTKVNIDVIYLGKNKTEWDELKEYIHKTFSIVVTECPVFIKDNQVLVYDSVEQYLEDYKWQVLRLKYKDAEYQHKKTSFELEFNLAKEKFIPFMLAKKERSNSEIDIFFKPYCKEIVERLERMTARKLTTEELALTKQTIKDLQVDLKVRTLELKTHKKNFESVEDPTIKLGIKSKKTTVNLFNADDVIDASEVDGITIWDGVDVFKEPESVETEETDTHENEYIDK